MVGQHGNCYLALLLLLLVFLFLFSFHLFTKCNQPAVVIWRRFFNINNIFFFKYFFNDSIFQYRYIWSGLLFFADFPDEVSDEIDSFTFIVVLPRYCIPTLMHFLYRQAAHIPLQSHPLWVSFPRPWSSLRHDLSLPCLHLMPSPLGCWRFCLIKNRLQASQTRAPHRILRGVSTWQTLHFITITYNCFFTRIISQIGSIYILLPCRALIKFIDSNFISGQFDAVVFRLFYY